MPIENELKYVLPLEFSEANLSGWTRQDIRQAYLEEGPRIRQRDDHFLFTYKKWVPDAKVLVEIETHIPASDFDLLWPLCVERVQKTRYVTLADECEWVIDFLREGSGDVYFVQAEVEMPEGQTAPDIIPEAIRDHIVYAVGADDNRFTNKKLSDPEYAARLRRKVCEPEAH